MTLTDHSAAVNAEHSAIAPVIEVSELTRRFGVRRALDGVSFTLHAGDCLALFGPNGAGKTTLLRVLAGLIRPTTGHARVAGVELPAGAAARSMVGLISHSGMLYDALSGLENVEFAARLYGVREPRAAAERALEQLRVLDRADSPVRALSRGLRQRVAIARAVVHRPRVVLLDEPYTGLDEIGAAALTSALATLRSSGATLLLVTHHLSEGLELASHTAIMREGRFARFEPRGDFAVESYRQAYRELVSS